MRFSTMELPGSRSSSTARRSSGATGEQSSPDRTHLRTSFLHDDRNSEVNHMAALLEAQAYHDRVRAAAIDAMELHKVKEQQERVKEEQRIQEERLKREAELIAEEQRLKRLEAQKVERPPSPPAPEPPATKPAQPAAVPVNGTPVSKATQTPSRTPLAPSPAAAQTPPSQPKTVAFQLPPTGGEPPRPLTNGFAAKPTTPTAAPTSILKPTTATPTTPKTVSPAVTPSSAFNAERYLQIHKELKNLRKRVEEQAKHPGSPLKGKLGDMRREIRKSIGQLTGERNANATPVNKILTLLRGSLEGSVPSEPLDGSLFVAGTRPGPPGASDKIPSLFLYLLNIFTKAIINQFINEAGANPRAADPVGVVTAQVFSQKEFQWRGGSLIDVLMAKFRVVCPVLFGFRGKDSTEQGRLAIGWRKDESGRWMPEQMHNDRMTGLGAGFAAISLRDFSKASRTNPYPPSNYWKAMAFIVNTPPELVSGTQNVVLKAMIDNFEGRILLFYGNAGLALLRVALLQFPKKSPKQSAAAGALEVLGDVLKRDRGLVLA